MKTISHELLVRMTRDFLSRNLSPWSLYEKALSRFSDFFSRCENGDNFVCQFTVLRQLTQATVCIHFRLLAKTHL